MSMYIKKIDKYTIESAPRNLGNVANYNSPANEVQLLADGWRRLVETPCPGWGYRATYAIRGEEVRQGWEALPLDGLKAERSEHIRQCADDAKREAERGFAAVELETRDMQAAGAADVVSSAGADSPDARCVKAIAAYRGMPVEETAARISGHVEMAAALAGKLIGVMNRLLDAIEAATSLEEVEAVEWPENFDDLEPIQS